MDAMRLREFAARNRLVHVWIELNEDPEAEDVLKNPSNSELARTIGLEAHAPREVAYELVVVGAGPRASAQPSMGPRRTSLPSPSSR
jgi:thioredoxin reductase (NADPH)